MIGKGNGSPLQYSCHENPMDRGAWQATVHRISESWTQLKRPSTHAQKEMIQTNLLTKWKESQRLKSMNLWLPGHIAIYDPAIPLLGIPSEETRIERDTCTPMFITALFIIARTWKQPRCPSADEWIGKLWYIYTMEYYSAITKNTFESVLMRWMKLEPII